MEVNQVYLMDQNKNISLGTVFADISQGLSKVNQGLLCCIFSLVDVKDIQQKGRVGENVFLLGAEIFFDELVLEPAVPEF